MMRHHLSLFVLAGFALAMLLVPPMPRAQGGAVAVPAIGLLCAPEAASGLGAARDWLGSLHGWPDSALVMNWRALVAASKGRAAPPGC